MPTFLLLVFGIFQFGHIWMARQVVNYAAYTSARSALVTVADPGGQRPNWSADEVHPIAHQSASRVTAWLSLAEAPPASGGGAPGMGPLSIPGSAAPLSVPGWGAIAGSQTSSSRTSVDVVFKDWNVGATVRYEFSLVTPIVGPLISDFMNGTSSVWNGPILITPTPFEDDKTDTGPPTIELKQTVWLPKPYRTVMGRGL